MCKVYELYVTVRLKSFLPCRDLPVKFGLLQVQDVLHKYKSAQRSTRYKDYLQELCSLHSCPLLQLVCYLLFVVWLGINQSK